MAKQYEQFKKDFDELKKAAKAGSAEIRRDAALVGQTSQIIGEGVKELGLRIQQLKSEGATGKALKEFASDPEVKKMVASLDGFMASLEKELKRITALHAKDFKSLLPRYKTLSKELQDEIASRKKQVSTKIGTGNKSLADMQKLHAELAKYGDDHELMAVVGFLPEEIAGHRKQLNRQIQDQIDKTHDAVLTALQAEMDEQALEGRNRKRNVSRAKGLAEQVLAECAKAQKALAERNNTELMRVKATVGKPMKELDELWSKYDRGLKDGWVRSKITESKDRTAIQADIKLVTDYRAKARAELTKIANARLTD